MGSMHWVLSHRNSLRKLRRTYIKGTEIDGVDALGAKPPQLAKETLSRAESVRRRIVVSCLAVAARLQLLLYRRLCLC